MDQGADWGNTLVSAYIYLEGGGAGAQSKDVDIRCREGFRNLLENCGFQRRMPRLVACGARESAFDDFSSAHSSGQAEYVGLWIDSEDPLPDLEAAWQYLQAREHWNRPSGAADDQVLFMTTCMETWFVADRAALKAHFGAELQDSSLPPLDQMERRTRHDVQDKLSRASRDCSNSYEKGRRSFAILGKLNPELLERLLPSFARVRRILNARL
jgi:hypothetical protein